MTLLRTYTADFAAEGDRPHVYLLRSTRWGALGFGLECNRRLDYVVPKAGADEPGAYTVETSRGVGVCTPLGRARAFLVVEQGGAVARPMDLRPALDHVAAELAPDVPREVNAAGAVGALEGGALGAGAVELCWRTSARWHGPLTSTPRRRLLPGSARWSTLVAGALLGASVLNAWARPRQLEHSLAHRDFVAAMQDTQDVLASAADLRPTLRPVESSKWREQRTLAPRLGGAALAMHAHAAAYLDARGITLERAPDAPVACESMLAESLRKA